MTFYWYFRCCHRTDTRLIISSVALFKSKQPPFTWFAEKNQRVWADYSEPLCFKSIFFLCRWARNTMCAQRQGYERLEMPLVCRSHLCLSHKCRMLLSFPSASILWPFSLLDAMASWTSSCLANRPFWFAFWLHSSKYQGYGSGHFKCPKRTCLSSHPQLCFFSQASASQQRTVSVASWHSFSRSPASHSARSAISLKAILQSIYLLAPLPSTQSIPLSSLAATLCWRCLCFRTFITLTLISSQKLVRSSIPSYGLLLPLLPVSLPWCSQTEQVFKWQSLWICCQLFHGTPQSWEVVLSGFSKQRLNIQWWCSNSLSNTVPLAAFHESVPSAFLWLMSQP